MATFSTNSVRHAYVANVFNSGLTNPTASNKGTFTGAVVSDGELYLKYVNTEGKFQITDKIPVANIRRVSSKGYSPKVLRKDAISFSAPITGEVYTIRFLFRNWGSGSAENQYFKHVGSYKAKAGDNAEDIVDAMVASATINFQREASSLFVFTKENTGSNAKLIVTEVDQPWVVGKQQGRNLDYTIQFVKVGTGSSETYEWGTVTNRFIGKIGNGTNKLTKDMEYFYLGERGDVYRNVGFPYTFDTQYLADATANYSVIDITYYSSEPHNGGAVKSEKQLTILCKETGTAATNYDLQIAIAGAINTATGATTVPLLVNPTTVINVGSLGTAGNATITGLTTATKYIVYVNAGETSEIKKYLKADGTLSTTETDVANLSGTAITGLTNGVRYAVFTY